jgi:hypothetical protein
LLYSHFSNSENEFLVKHLNIILGSRSSNSYGLGLSLELSVPSVILSVFSLASHGAKPGPSVTLPGLPRFFLDSRGAQPGPSATLPGQSRGSACLFRDPHGPATGLRLVFPVILPEQSLRGEATGSFLDPLWAALTPCSSLGATEPPLPTSILAEGCYSTAEIASYQSPRFGGFRQSLPGFALMSPVLLSYWKGKALYINVLSMFP